MNLCDDLWWFMMVYDGVWWFMMVYDGVWWCMMVYDGLWWFMIDYDGTSMIWLVVDLAVRKIWVHQLGWWNSQCTEKEKVFQTTNQWWFRKNMEWVVPHVLGLFDMLTQGPYFWTGKSWGGSAHKSHCGSPCTFCMQASFFCKQK